MSRLFDRSRLRTTEDALSLIENILDSSTEYSVIGKDLEGNILLWNEGARQIYGYDAVEVVGEVNSSILHTPEDIAAGKHKEILAVARAIGKWEGTLTRVRKDGSRFPARIVITPRRDVSGKAIGFLLISKDISDELPFTEPMADKQFRMRLPLESGGKGRDLAGSPIRTYLLAEEHARIFSEKLADQARELTLKQHELEEEIESRKTAQRNLEVFQARHRSLLEHLPVGVLAWNVAEQRLEVVNPALVRMLGYDDPGPLLKPGFMHNLCGCEPNCVNCEYLVRETMAEKQIKHEVRWRRKDGTVILVQLSCFAIQGGKRVVATAQDITHERALELQVRQDQKLEALGQLAGSVAHDFNNLLMVIVGCSDLLLARLSENPQHRKYVEQIRQAAQSSAGLTRQLLAFSRERASEIKGLDLNGVIAELQQILLHLLGKKIKLRIIPHQPQVWVEVDRNHLEQIIVNFVVNARDAMPAGGLLEIQSFVQELTDDEKLAPGKYVCLQVTDTGQGIDPNIQRQLFQPFFSTKGERGTGLGLATVARIVKHAGGDVRVQSAVGAGSTFTVLLPAATPRLESALSKPAESRRGCESILVVDDEAAIRMATSEFLSAQGYKVREAATGSEAVSIILQGLERVDLVVTDLNMPVMSGIEVAEEARRLRPGLPVVLITGSVDAEDQQLLAGFPEKCECIQKPFALAALASSIRRLLDGSEVGTPLPAC